jgi:hypothetical protein
MIDVQMPLTLGDVRRAIATDPPEKKGIELMFDIPGTERPGYLPDAILIPRDLSDRVAAGGYSDLPGSTPLEEIDW